MANAYKSIRKFLAVSLQYTCPADALLDPAEYYVKQN